MQLLISVMLDASIRTCHCERVDIPEQMARAGQVCIRARPGVVQRKSTPAWDAKDSRNGTISSSCVVPQIWSSLA